MVRSTVSSNAAFLVPLIMSVHVGAWTHAAVVLGAILASCYYHVHNEQRGAIIDRAYAWLLVCSNLIVLSIAGWPSVCVVSALCVAVFALTRLWVYWRDDWVWHALAAVTTGVCVSGLYR